jgi:hypothetical protein
MRCVLFPLLLDEVVDLSIVSLRHWYFHWTCLPQVLWACLPQALCGLVCHRFFVDLSYRTPQVLCGLVLSKATGSLWTFQQRVLSSFTRSTKVSVCHRFCGLLPQVLWTFATQVVDFCSCHDASLKGATFGFLRSASTTRNGSSTLVSSRCLMFVLPHV